MLLVTRDARSRASRSAGATRPASALRRPGPRSPGWQCCSRSRAWDAAAGRPILRAPGIRHGRPHRRLRGFGAVMMLVSLIVLTLGGLGRAFPQAPRRAARSLRHSSWRPASTSPLASFVSRGPWARLLATAGRNPERNRRRARRTPARAMRPWSALGTRPLSSPLTSPCSPIAGISRGALWEIYDEPDVDARPWDAEAACGPSGLIFADETRNAPCRDRNFDYDRLIFVDASTATASRVRSQTECAERRGGVHRTASRRSVVGRIEDRAEDAVHDVAGGGRLLRGAGDELVAGDRVDRAVEGAAAGHRWRRR